MNKAHSDFIPDFLPEDNGFPVLLGEVLFDCFEEDGSRVLGGAPFNVAWHLQGFGLKPVLISRIAEDEPGRYIRSIMQQWQMSEIGLQLDSLHATGEVNISLDAGQPSFDILADVAYDYIDAGSIPPLRPCLLYHGSLGVRQATSLQALEDLISNYQPPVFFDVNLRSPWWEKSRVLSTMDHTNWLKVNDHELDALIDGSDKLEDKARMLQQQHDIEMVFVTRGEKGAMSLDNEGAVHQVEPETVIKVVDTVGAGDAFAAVCIVGIIRHWPMPQILQRAQAFASLVVAQRGATIQDPDVYPGIMDEWQL